jgi:hypothetical protein
VSALLTFFVINKIIFSFSVSVFTRDKLVIQSQNNQKDLSRSSFTVSCIFLVWLLNLNHTKKIVGNKHNVIIAIL